MNNNFNHINFKNNESDEINNNINNILAEKQLKILNKTEKKKLINNTKKISYINIDSNLRNKIYKNIINNAFNNLTYNPVIFNKDDDTIEIKINNNNIINQFTKLDKIMIENITTQEFIFNSCLSFLNNSKYIKIKHKNHNITKNYKKYYKSFDVKINIQSDLYSIENIPINLINGIHNIFIYDDLINNENFIIDPMHELIKNLILKREETKETISKNYYFFELPMIFFNNYNNEYVCQDNISIQFMNIAGIPLNYLNSNFPININHKESNKIINDIYDDKIIIKSDIKAYTNEHGGGNNVIVSKIISVQEAYINPNSYMISSETIYYNISSIELISTEIPNTFFPINKYNNKLYWKNIYDGDHVYCVEIPEGSYNSSLLEKNIEQAINSIPRINSITDDPKYHNIKVTINIDNNLVLFDSYIRQDLDSELIFNQINDSQNIKMGIKYNNNIIVNIGDNIIIDNASNTNGVPSNIINGKHNIIDISNNYIFVILPLFNKTNFNNSNNRNTIRVNYPFMIKLIFSYNDTLGNILGFNNVGEPYSETPFLNKIDNNIIMNDHEDINNKNNIINLSGEQYYIYLYLNNFNNIINNKNDENIFGKILIDGKYGDFLYNTFVDSPLFFDPPLTQVSEFNVKFFHSDNTLVDFYNINHSFTLKIVEEVSHPTKGLDKDSTIIL